MKPWIALALLVVVAEAKSVVSPAAARLEQAADEAAEVQVVADLDALTTPEADPQEIAIELMRLQQELGGSVVTDQFPMPSQLEEVSGSLWQDNPQKQVEALQDASRLVEEAAYSLERLDLYEQADDLRAAAGRLRSAARRARKDSLDAGS